MALDFPDPAVENPWNDGTREWTHDGGGWLGGTCQSGGGGVLECSEIKPYTEGWETPVP